MFLRGAVRALRCSDSNAFVCAAVRLVCHTGQAYIIISILLISNHNSFQVLLDKIASPYFI